MTKELRSSHLLLVEGKDDKDFFDSLKSELDFDDSNIDVIPYEGKTKLRRFLGALSEFPNFSHVNALAVVRDADKNPLDAIKSVRDALSTLLEPPPVNHMEFEGSTLKRDHPRGGQQISTAFVILPSSSRIGALENLLIDAVDDKERMECVSDFIKCLDGKGITKDETKAKITLQAYLAAHTKAENELRVAFRSHHIPANSEIFKGLRDFLQKMASL